jgi:hypothetical protein
LRVHRSALGWESQTLPPYQSSLLRDLADPLDEEALADMLAYWNYDLERLTTRGRGWHDGIPAKPQIDVVIELTSKGNLKAEWFPRGWNRYGIQFDSIGFDFQYFYRAESRSSGYHSRPSNELFFLHDLEMVLSMHGSACEIAFTMPLNLAHFDPTRRWLRSCG